MIKENNKSKTNFVKIITLILILLFLQSNNLFISFSSENTKNFVNTSNKDAIIMDSLENYSMISHAKYDWYEAANDGDHIILNDDDSFDYILPFEFNFYNRIFDKVYISSNGWISFYNPSPINYDFEIPNSFFMFYYCIAVYVEDLGHLVDIYIKEFDDSVIIEYYNAKFIFGQSIGSFQIILYKNGDIKLQFENVQLPLGIPTIGLNNGVTSAYFNVYDSYDTSFHEFTILFTTRDVFFVEYPWVRYALPISGGAILLIITVSIVFRVRKSKRKQVLNDSKIIKQVDTAIESQSSQEPLKITSIESSIGIDSKDKWESEIISIYQDASNNDIILLDVLISKLNCEGEELEDMILRLIQEGKIKGELKSYIGEFHIRKNKE
ncbi:MAG: hypothetical protein ACFFDW_15300 [Candidatus Thorarchaeota archaeon]